MRNNTIYRELALIHEELRALRSLIVSKPIVKYAIASESTSSILLSLPDYLRKTYIALLNNGRSTATEIAILTHRARALESHYLNNLVLSKNATKSRNGRKCEFEAVVKGAIRQ